MKKVIRTSENTHIGENDWKNIKIHKQVLWIIDLVNIIYKWERNDRTYTYKRKK